MGHTRSVAAAILFASAVLALSVGGLAAPEAAPRGEPADVSKASPASPPAAVAEYDAQFVSMEAPKQVLTDQVFTVRITMKNTGSKAWEGQAHAHLHSQDPPDNTMWGTNRTVQSSKIKVQSERRKKVQSSRFKVQSERRTANRERHFLTLNFDL